MLYAKDEWFSLSFYQYESVSNFVFYYSQFKYISIWKRKS